MASQRKIFKRVGLRRDKNFADLSDSVQGLNNLLDTLIDSPDATFISQDLNAIRGIFSTGLQSSEYRNFIGSAVQQTDTQGVNSAIFPRITYQNRLDKFEVAAGNPRINGGNGLTANYFNQDQVQDTEAVFTGITTGTVIKSDTFWEAGQFEYTGKIHPQLVNTAGGVQWDGFFVPTFTGSYTFYVSSTFGFTSEFQTEGYTSGINTFTEYSRVGLTTTITATSSTASNVVTIPTGNVNNVGIGMSISGTGIRAGSKIESISRSSTASSNLTLENPDGDPITSAQSSNFSITCNRNAGVSVSSNFSTFQLERYIPYRVRFRFFIPPGVNSIGLTKSINFSFLTPGGSSSNYLRYQNLYDVDYKFTPEVRGTFNKFLDQSVLFGGNKSDGTETIGGTNSNGYVRVKSTKKVDIKYLPKTSLAAITRRTFTTSWNSGTKLISCSDTTDIEVGNYVFGSGLTANANTPVRVTDVITNQLIVIDAATTSSGSSQSLTVINHRGFVKKVTASGSSGTVSISNGNTVGIRSKMIAIWDGVTQYTGITTSGASSSFQVTPSQGFGTRGVYVYESRGLIDKALNAFCVPAQTRCVFVTANATAGDTSITVESTVGIGAGWEIQGFPFASGTTVVGAPSGNTINLSQAIVKNINADSNFTATNSGNDKQLCCPPTDTSPPFNPTEEGLETTSTQPNLEITGGAINFDELTATVATNKISEYSDSDKSTNRLQLKGGDGVTYNILCQ